MADYWLNRKSDSVSSSLLGKLPKRQQLVQLDIILHGLTSDSKRKKRKAEELPIEAIGSRAKKAKMCVNML